LNTVFEIKYLDGKTQPTSVTGSHFMLVYFFCTEIGCHWALG